MPTKVWGEITYPLTTYNGITIDGWDRISYFMSHFKMNVIIYPCWNLS